MIYVHSKLLICDDEVRHSRGLVLLSHPAGLLRNHFSEVITPEAAAVISA